MIDAPVWEEGGWMGFPRLRESVEADLCVVGLGGSGVAAIIEGLERGLTVVGVDAGKVADGAAGRNGGFLLAGMPLFYHDAGRTYGASVARDFYQLTIEELDRAFAIGGRRTGSLRVASSDVELADIDEEYLALTEDGFAVERYEGPEGKGLLIPWDGVCNPLSRVRERACFTADEGALLFENSPAVRIREGLVETGLGRVEAAMILVAVDGGLEVIFPALADRVRTASLQMLATYPDPGVSFERPVYTDFGYNYYQQLPDGSVALGGRRNHHLERSWTTEPGLIEEIQNELDLLLGEIGVRAAVSHRWFGGAAFTEDFRPVFAEMAPGVVAIGAYSGHGNIVGSIYAREAVSQMAEGRPIEPPL
jgi:gamma-glutamylputrescine oxidase